MTASELILPCPAFPGIIWWQELLKNEGKAQIFTGQNLSNWTAPNRYQIATANGPLWLSLPLKGGRKSRINLQETCIDYTHDWQRQHWRGLISAYGRAAFFEHYKDGLEAIIYGNFERLLDFNQAGIEWLARGFQIELPLFEKEISMTKQTILFQEKKESIQPEYYQVFSEKLGFLPGLSAIDLLMNEGPQGRMKLS